MLGDSPKLNINFNSDVWVGQDVSRLGYFSNIKKIIRHLRGGGVRKFAIEIVRDKQAYRIGLGNIEDASPFVDAVTWHVDLLNAVRLLTEAVFHPVVVKSFSISAEDEEAVFRYASLLEGDIVEAVKPGHEFCRGVFSPEGFKDFEKMLHKEHEFSVRFVEDDGGFFNLLGNEIKPPPVDVFIDKCAVNEFSYIKGDNVRKEGFVAYAVGGTKCVLSLQKDRQWVLDSKD